MNMTREEYLKQISNKLAIWQADIKLRGEINLYDSHIIAEYYVKELFNMFFGYDLENLNDSSKNFPGIDLGDQTQGVAVQVTATKTRAKIQGTLDKFIENKLYKDYPHLYIFILSEKQNSYKPFDTKGLFSFDIDKQILDIGDLIRLANTLNTTDVQRVAEILEVSTSNLDYNTRYKLSISLQYYPKTGLGTAFLIRLTNRGQRPITYTDVALKLDSGERISYSEITRRFIQLSTPIPNTLHESEFSEFLFPLYHMNEIMDNKFTNPLQVVSVEAVSSYDETYVFPSATSESQKQFEELRMAIQNHWSEHAWLDDSAT